MQWLSLVVMVNALAAVPNALLIRDLKFKQCTKIDAISTVAGSITGITLALGGWGIWALVSMELVRTSIRSLLLIQSSGWRPGLNARQHHFADLLSFNITVLATTVLARADELLPRALVAALLGPAALGFWLMAHRIFSEIQNLATVPLKAVAMSAVARVQSKADQLKKVISGALPGV